MDIYDLRKALREGIVIFQFQKIDGTLRQARGTTCPDLVPSDDVPKGVRSALQQAAYRAKTVAFYDIDRKAWRSMRIDAIWSYERVRRLS